MGVPTIDGKRVYFPKVREARELLREKALDLVNKQIDMIDQAAKEGKVDVALEANQWLLEHTPAGDDGERVIDASAAKPKELEGRQGPMIQIGIALDAKPKELAPHVIDLDPIVNE